MNFLFPLSSAFNCITASPVVPDPEKKSITSESVLLPICNKYFISKEGLGVLKRSVTGASGNNFFSSYFAPRVCPVVSSSLNNVEGGSPSISARYVRRIKRVSSSEKRNSPVFSFSFMVSLDHLQPFAGCLMIFPLGVVISNCRLGLSPGLLTGFPSNHGPRGSLSGFLK